MSQPLDRRTLLRGAALAGAACAGVAACSAGTSGSEDAAEKSPGKPAEPVDLGPASAVPVGGSKLYGKQRLVVSQPAKGEFRCFSSTCTHQGATLNAVNEREQATCPLHGSRFDVTSGKVIQGPATKPLPEIPVKVEGGNLIAG